MQVTSTSLLSGAGQAERLLAGLLQLQPASDGGAQGADAASSGRPPPPPGPPPGQAGGQMANKTLTSLLSVQEDQDSQSLAQSLIESADSDGDGSLSLEELQAALPNAGEQLGDALSRLDEDGDGKLSGGELETALQAKGPPPRPPSKDDVAASLIDQLESDDDGGLSLTEVQSSLSQIGINDDASSAFGGLDSDGDGVLSAGELAAASSARDEARAA